MSHYFLLDSKAICTIISSDMMFHIYINNQYIGSSNSINEISHFLHSRKAVIIDHNYLQHFWVRMYGV